MNIQTMSIVVGTKACQAKCPFCVSKMTDFDDLRRQSQPFNEDHIEKAIQMAQIGNCSTCLLTGKGEPTLYLDHITRALQIVDNRFPFIELQTNGLVLATMSPEVKRCLAEWKLLGLTTIAISTSGYISAGVNDVLRERVAVLNKDHYAENYPDLKELSRQLQVFGFTRRLSVMAQRGGIETMNDVRDLINSCQEGRFNQLTIRPLNAPKEANNQSEDAAAYVKDAETKLFNKAEFGEGVSSIEYWLQTFGTQIRRLSGGGRVFDIGGQNVAIYNCLTVDKDEDLRSLIVFPNGTIKYSWEYPGAILLDGY